MENVKKAFNRVKQDIFSLVNELNSLKEEISVLRRDIFEINVFLNEFCVGKVPTDVSINPTLNTLTQTNHDFFKPLNDQIYPISTGNRGVPTDRQTNQQTDRQTHFLQKRPEKEDSKDNFNSINDAVEILDSLDNIKKEIRLKFKRLTDQEFLIFSKLYQLSEQNGSTDYNALSNSLNLSESSIRDYVGKLIKKGIPVEKIKINNKNITLSIPDNLKKIASLSTILQLREL